MQIWQFYFKRAKPGVDLHGAQNLGKVVAYGHGVRYDQMSLFIVPNDEHGANGGKIAWMQKFDSTIPAQSVVKVDCFCGGPGCKAGGRHLLIRSVMKGISIYLLSPLKHSCRFLQALYCRS
ncbi:MAG: hypothetical protein ACI9O0_000223 [Paracoccaceae bacterium]